MRKGQRRLEEVNGSWTTEDGREGETAAHSSRQVAVTDSGQWEEGGGEWWTAVAERERESGGGRETDEEEERAGGGSVSAPTRERE